MKKLLSFTSILLLLVSLFSCKDQIPEELPNILWITTEDNSPFLGCYGDDFATTPNLDQLAAEGIRYMHAYANAPVCAPTRNTIITGVYASSGGNEQMRSYYEKSDDIHFYPEYLREKGYYCTNNSKEDYNITAGQIKDIWDESSRKAHYRNRAEGQPFFAVFNSTISHESSIHRYKADSLLRHSPDDVKLPPYHPDIPEMRHDWAHYYDNVEDMDSWVGKILQELEESGEADNTIVFYYSDHGGILGRSKRFLYESGTNIPFIIRVPEKYAYLLEGKKPGNKDERLISFVDLAPTLLSIIGTDIPEFMQGKAFLGKQKTKDPEYAYMFRGRMDERYDMSRSVRNDDYRYSINFMPFRPYGQHLNYLWKAPSMPAWEKAFEEGLCNPTQSAFFLPKPVEELYHTSEDPWEVNNLADDPAYEDKLVEMREACKSWMLDIKDAGFIPEPIRVEKYGQQATYDIVREEDFNLEEIMDAAWLAAEAGQSDIPALLELLNNEDPTIRYWAAVGLLNLGENARSAEADMLEAIKNNDLTVVAVLAESLYLLGDRDEALAGIMKALDSPNSFVRCYVMNTVDILDIQDEVVKEKVLTLRNNPEWDEREFDSRMVMRLMDKYGWE